VSCGAAFTVRDLRLATIAALAVAALGVPLGVLWALLGPRAQVVVTADGAVLAGHEQEVFFGGEGTFVLIGLVAGVTLGAGLYLWRRGRGPWMAVGLAAGSLAGAYVAWKTGHQIGLSTFNRLVEDGRIGQRFLRPMDVRAEGVLFVQPLVAVIVYVLAAGWSRFGDLGRYAAPEPAFSSHSAELAAPPAAPVPPPAGGASSPPA
jgi:hypothetical protein